MAVTLTINGVSFAYPETGGQNWGTSATNWAVAVSSGLLQKAGGAFTLTADVNFGTSFGLVSKYFTSRTANASSAGAVRFANDEGAGWRNAANSDDLILKVDSSNNLVYNGNVIATEDIGAANTVPVSTGSGIVWQGIEDANITNVAAITRSKLASGNNYRILANNSSGVMSENAALTAAHVVFVDANGQLSGEATLSKSRGGAGASMASVTFPSTGVLVTEAGTQTLTNKTLGGLSFSTFSTGDIIYASASNNLSRLSVGSSGQVLTVSAGVPSWASSSPNFGYVAKTHSDTGAVLSDGLTLWTLTNGNDDTASIPAAASNSGKRFVIFLAGTTAAFNKLTVSRSGSDNFILEDGTTATSFAMSIGGETYELQSDGVSNYLVIRHLVPNVSASAFRQTSAMTITGSETEVVFNGEDFDTQNAFSTSNGRFTAPIAGTYRVTFVFTLAMGGTAAAEFDGWFYKNGAGTKYGDFYINDLVNSKVYLVTSTALIQLAKGDYVSAWGVSVTQNSTLDEANRRTSFTVERIGK